MAYSKETVNELLTVKKGSNSIIFKQIIGDNKESVDIREHFENEDGEIIPTKKGVRFNAENTLDVVRALVNILDATELDELRDEIDQMLSVEDDEDEDETEE